MTFFIDSKPFTHRARFYGFPCYYRQDGTEGCELAGTNVVWDWCILHLAPWLHMVCEWLKYLACPWAYEPGAWPIELRGELPKR